MRIRPAEPDDYEAFASMFPELGVDDPIPSREKWSVEFVPTTMVAEHAGVVAGYAWFQLYADEGIVRNVVVAPNARKLGIGAALLKAVAERLRAAGLRRWALNVKPDNEPALALYRRFGFAEVFRSFALTLEWSLLSSLPSRGGLESIEVTPELDSAVEQQQVLTRGLLATSRALPKRVLRAIRDGSRFVGAAVFVPAFPGAYPFRADSIEVAHALLTELQRHALPEFPFVKVVIEGQPALSSALQALGATVRLEIARLEGSL